MGFCFRTASAASEEDAVVHALLCTELGSTVTMAPQAAYKPVLIPKHHRERVEFFIVELEAADKVRDCAAIC